MKIRPVSNRVLSMKPSGVRKYFALAATMDKCLDLSIGQPNFTVEDELKELACTSIRLNKNGYTQSSGNLEAREAIRKKYALSKDSDFDVLITSGVMGGLFLAFSTLLDPDDEILIPDPYFVGYKEAALLLGAKPVCFDTYPTFAPCVERIEPLITNRTKAIVISSPSNPTGYTLSQVEIDALQELADAYGLYLIYDEIYEAFCYDKLHVKPFLKENVIILNGLSKSHAMTGWRIAWAVASKELISQFEKVQQFTFVCPPAPFQNVLSGINWAQKSPHLEEFKRKRDFVFSVLSPYTEIAKPGGAFYFFPKVPNGTGEEFVERALEQNLLVIPSSVFSQKMNNFRLSYAVSDEILSESMRILRNIYQNV